MDKRYSELDKSIRDAIKEEQVKLGFRKEVIRLYYPLEAVNRLLGTEHDIAAMYKELEGFTAEENETLGSIVVSNKDERFCFRLPEEASVYVHEHTPGEGFIYDFIAVIGRHGISVDEVIAVFHKYSEHVHVEAIRDNEFDYLIYFEDGIPDDYRYCLTVEEDHIIYHRYTKSEYEAFGF